MTAVQNRCACARHIDSRVLGTRTVLFGSHTLADPLRVCDNPSRGHRANHTTPLLHRSACLRSVQSHMNTVTADLLAMARRCARRYRSLPPTLSREDIEQEAVLALLESMSKYDPNRHRCNKEDWLAGRITNRLARLVRKEQARTGREEEYQDCSAAGEGRDGHSDAGELVELARRHLPPRQARVVEMTAEGYTDEEIAGNLGCSVGAMRTDRSRALAAMREVVRV